MYTDIELAEQQLTCFTHAKEGYNILELAEGMGLTPEEWREIKARQRVRISPSDADALDKYLVGD
jgi:hypothetical protein